MRTIQFRSNEVKSNWSKQIQKLHLEIVGKLMKNTNFV